MKVGIKIALCVTLLSSLSFGGEQFAMSDSDRAMYAEMLENNPADIMVEWKCTFRIYGRWCRTSYILRC